MLKYYYYKLILNNPSKLHFLIYLLVWILLQIIYLTQFSIYCSCDKPFEFIKLNLYTNLYNAPINLNGNTYFLSYDEFKSKNVGLGLPNNGNYPWFHIYPYFSWNYEKAYNSYVLGLTEWTKDVLIPDLLRISQFTNKVYLPYYGLIDETECLKDYYLKYASLGGSAPPGKSPTGASLNNYYVSNTLTAHEFVDNLISLIKSPVIADELDKELVFKLYKAKVKRDIPLNLFGIRLHTFHKSPSNHPDVVGIEFYDK